MIGSNLLLSDDGYQISRSVRLRSSASAYFSRTPASAGSLTTWTWSGWVKLGAISSPYCLFGYQNYVAGVTDIRHYLSFDSGGLSLYYANVGTSTVFGSATSTAVYRDPSAWYHVVGVWDTTNATANDRIRIYVNGQRITSLSVNVTPTQNLSGILNTAVNTGIGAMTRSAGPVFLLDGYLAEVNFIDGQALTPSSFGQNDPITGVWQAKKYAGTYGTNGFYLNFNDNSAATAAAIGKDYSGNGNNWTPNNISVTAGVTYDSMIDSPTVGYAASNYCVCNPILGYSSKITPTNANLTVTLGTGSNAPFGSRATFGVSSGKWYWETTITAKEAAAGEWVGVGIVADNVNWPSGNFLGANTGGYEYFNDGVKYGNGVSTAYGASYTVGDVVGVALDATNQTLVFYKNGVSQGTAFTSIGSSSLWVPAFDIYRSTGTTQTLNVNFGQRPFTYTPPAGFVALNTYNLPAATINNGATVMAASAYTGNGSTQSIANSVSNAAAVSFKPDLVWTKARNVAYGHVLYDSVRGALKFLESDATNAEVNGGTGLTSFDANGFTTTAYNGTNATGTTYIAWQWQAGQGTTSSNTNGSITSTVSVNQSAGFSVVTYTGTGANATVGHGLGVAPKFIITKSRNAAQSWYVYHSSYGATKTTYLNLTDAAFTDSRVWNNTEPTSSVFSIGTIGPGAAVTEVAYCWSEVAGYSKFGSYTGNGSADGPFVYCGFRPRFILFKDTTGATSNWIIHDTARDTYNQAVNTLAPNSTAVEAVYGSSYGIDVTANGFKIRLVGAPINTSGNVHIFAAFAENPFKYALAR